MVHARRAALVAASLLSLLHFSCFDILRLPIMWDTRYYLYWASRVAQGAVPYRDFFEMKTPLSILAGGLLHRLGHATGVEPVFAVRAGQLFFAAAAGLLLFALFRRLTGGRLAPGLLALLVYCGFPLLGWLPSIGVLPKLLMALFASATALAVARRRFLLAGAAGMLAFLDWQIGALAVAGALAAALLARRQRLRAAIQVILGALLAGAPFLWYFAASGALRPAFGHTIGTLFARGAQSAQKETLAKAAHFLDTVRVGCEGKEWLFFLGVLGMLVFPLWLLRWRGRARLAPGVALAVYHYGVVAFSLFDYQSYGDLFLVLHSSVFFAAVVLVEVMRRMALAARHRRRLVELALLLVLAALVRPALLRSEFRILSPTVGPSTTLADQQEVARRVAEEARLRRLACIGPVELLYLSEAENAVPFAYWNMVTYDYYRRSRRETYREARRRLLASYGAELLVLDASVPAEPGDRRISSTSGAYAVTVRAVSGSAQSPGL